jgi:hypothetical protein
LPDGWLLLLEVEQRRIVPLLRYAARVARCRAAETARSRKFGNAAGAFLQEDQSILKLEIREIDLNGD